MRVVMTAKPSLPPSLVDQEADGVVAGSWPASPSGPHPVLLILLILILSLSNALTATAAQSGPGSGTPLDTEPPARGRTAIHDLRAVLAPADSPLSHQPGFRLWHHYGSFALFQVEEGALTSLSAADLAEVRVDPGLDWILFDRHPINTRGARVDLPSPMVAGESAGASLHLIQFVGPIKDGWLDAVRASGVVPVQYLANNAYLVWADAAGRVQMNGLAEQREFVQYSAPYHPAFKLGPSIEKRILSGADPSETLPVVIQLYDHPGNEASLDLIAQLTLEPLTDWYPILNFQNRIIRLRATDLETIAGLPDVVWLGEYFPRELLDEVQTQILAGNLDEAQSGPSGPGYQAWLDALGFSQNPADYPIVSVADDGIGDGTTTKGAGDRTLTLLGDGVTSRISFVKNCTSDANADGRGGHGHLNTSIISGFDNRSGFPYRYPGSFQRGQGINLYGRTGNTKIFKNSGQYDLPACGTSDAGLIKSQQDNGALISSNSWGCGPCAGTYDDAAQAYDAGVRDADPEEEGNQQMVFVFSAGNSGPTGGTIGTPGNGKNMITVGASENQRPRDENGNWTDGCNIGPSGADNAMDVAGFSSRGPAPGARVKPEVIAPGTHIQGMASSATGYSGSDICDPYRPSGQTLFAASSGTSHSTPAVAGLASLYYRWLAVHYGLTTPSPAMIKAYLLGHPTYLTGVGANDSLPSISQGYGMPNMKSAFDNTPRLLLDQTHTFTSTGQTWTWSGGVADSSKPLRIVLAYTDAPGAIGTSPQVNNLDLTLIANEVTYLGNHFSGQWSTTGGTSDGANNYEAIYLPAGTTDNLSIRVTAANIAGDGVPGNADSTDQDFALACYNCAQEADFTLAGTPNSQGVCAPATAAYRLDLGSILGFANPVTLSASGQPAGTTAVFNPNPVTTPGISAFTLGNTGAAPAGNYSLRIEGTASGGTPKGVELGLNLFNRVPEIPTLVEPINGTSNVSLTPNFIWNEAPQAQNYTIEVSRDFGFTNLIASDTGLTSPAWSIATELATSTRYYWRVKASNPCGLNITSGVFSFTTLLAPGDCAPGSTTNILYQNGFEEGSGGWTSSGTGNSWALTRSNPRSGIQHFHANDPDLVSDQRLASPAISLPAGQNPVVLRFWHAPYMESAGSGACYDGGLLEISTNGGTTWTPLAGSAYLTGGYSGPIISGYENPLAGLPGWCSTSEAYLNTLADLSAFAGQSVQLRLRLGSDTSVGRPGWDLDDLMVQSCLAPSATCDPGPLTIGPQRFGPGSYYLASEQGISTQGTVEVQSGADLSLSAPHIHLAPGFHLARGALLKVRAEEVSCAVPAEAQAGLVMTPPSTARTTLAKAPPDRPIPFSRLDQLPPHFQTLLKTKGVDLSAASQVLLDARGVWLLFTTPQALEARDGNGTSDIYRFELTHAHLSLISRTPQGYAGRAASSYPAADGLGARIVFQSDADDLVAGDDNGVTDIFLHELPLGLTRRITTSATQISAHPALDPEGIDLVYDQQDAEGERDILLESTLSDTLPEALSLAQDERGLVLDNHHPAISADGRFILYLEEGLEENRSRCQIHFLDRDGGAYRRQPCPSELAALSEEAHPYFSASGDWVEWYLPDGDSPLLVPNPLFDQAAGTWP